MTDKAWVGSHNNNASNPNNWSPTGMPRLGDTLTMLNGTMNVRDDNLAGDTLVIGGNQTSATATLNLSHYADASLDIAQFSNDQVTVNVSGSDTLKVHTEFPSTLEMTVNLANHASLTGAFVMTFGSVTLNGGETSRFVNNGASTFQGSKAVLDADVRGTGTFSVETAQGSGGNLEFGDSVSYGQTVEVTGDPGRGLVSHVRVDHPDEFAGAIGLGVFGEVDLQGLINADSYTYQNDMLSIYSGNRVIDTVRLTTPPPPSGPSYDLAVFQTPTGVAIDHGGVPSGGKMLPIHV